jgi:hypothetical protein
MTLRTVGQPEGNARFEDKKLLNPFQPEDLSKRLSIR